MYFNSSCGEIYYEICGLDSSPTIVFTHGMFLDHQMFRMQIPVFKNRYRLVLWDMPGHGRSAALDKDFDFSVAAEVLVELLEELDIESVVLVGFSLGGGVIQHIAVKYPERVTAVAVDGIFPLHENLRKLSFMQRIMITYGRLLPDRQFTKSMHSFFNKMTSDLEDNEMKEYIEKCCLKVDKKRFLQMAEGLRKGVREGLEKPVTQLLLIIHGEAEMEMLRKMCAKWHENSPGSEYVVILGSGHGTNYIKPKEYNKALMSFLSRLN